MRAGDRRGRTLAVIRFNVPAHPVVASLYGTGAGCFVNADPLCAARRARFGNPVGLDDQIAGGWRYIKTISRARIAVIQHLVVSKSVAMAAILWRLLAEIHAARAVARNRIIDKLIVGIFM